MILLTVLIMSSSTRFVQQVIPFTISHRIGQVIFVSEVIFFSCLITVLICIKNPLLFDPCISISNKLILVFSYIALCVYCFMWSLCSISIVLLCMLMCVCRILIKITYLLTYPGDVTKNGIAAFDDVINHRGETGLDCDFSVTDMVLPSDA